ncbi:hypothetical protein ABH926_009316 [Catenulispora sp. GP43]|uniref:hypothetical protein n=1 Tax=Catenulispora sp. GP43 TaxID=3156263 RepID=UPI003514CE86
MTARIEHSALDLGPELTLKKGGQGRIIPVDRPRDTDGHRLIFKRYRPEWLDRLDERALDALGDLPAHAGPDALWLRERTAWPQALITEGGRVIGFLMREIPAEFSFSHLSPSGVTQTTAEYAFLLNEDRYLQDIGLMVSDRDRLKLLADIADSLVRLHRLGARVGDFSPKNMLFSLPTHRTFYLDCDSMRLHGADVLPQAHTPDWDLPPGEEPATPAADTLKFGLLAIRLFARDQSSRDPSRLGRVAPRLENLARASQSTDPARRGTPEDWIPELRAAAAAADPNPPTATIHVPAPPLGAPAGPFGRYGAPGAAGPHHAAQPTPPRNRSGVLVALGGLLTAGVVAVGVAVANGSFHDVAGSSGTTSSLSVSQDDNGVPTNAGGSASTDPNGGDTATTDTGGDTDTPSPTPTPPPSPPATTAVGLVQIDPSLVGDPRSVQVATLFDSYFSDITTKNFDAVFALYDPSGDLNTNDQQQRDSFEQADKTSTDDNATLTALSPAGPGAATTADVTFRSQQAAGYGPGNDPNQTCTMWSLTYTLTYTSDDKYLIKSATGTPSACS